jgi:hypothetical protein
MVRALVKAAPRKKWKAPAKPKKEEKQTLKKQSILKVKRPMLGIVSRVPLPGKQ